MATARKTTTLRSTRKSKARPARRRSRGRRVELRTAVRAAPATVWSALSTGPGLVRWHARDAHLDAEAGGAYRLAWGDATASGEVTAVQAGRRIDLTWHHDTQVSFRLARRHGGRETVVTVRHEGIPAGPAGAELYAQLRQGWTFALVNLKSVVERGVDLRERDRRRTFARGWANCWD
jgi:uncharacterized protein YndB with AHSA1/START domain